MISTNARLQRSVARRAGALPWPARPAACLSLDRCRLPRSGRRRRRARGIGRCRGAAEPAIEAVVAEATEHLVVSEVMTGGASASDEFIELYNPGSRRAAAGGAGGDLRHRQRRHHHAQGVLGERRTRHGAGTPRAHRQRRRGLRRRGRRDLHERAGRDRWQRRDPHHRRQLGDRRGSAGATPPAPGWRAAGAAPPRPATRSSGCRAATQGSGQDTRPEQRRLHRACHAGPAEQRSRHRSRSHSTTQRDAVGVADSSMRR